MRRTVMMVFIGFLAGACRPSSHVSREYAVHGEDDRKDIVDLRSNDPARAWARSVGVVVHASSIVEDGGSATVRLDGPELGAARKLCPDERFVTQPAVGLCSVFLVAPRLVATAAHCLFAGDRPDALRVVFDYALDAPGRDPRIVRRGDVYRLASVAAFTFDERLGADFAAFWLDRDVGGRTPLPVSDKLSANDSLTLVGYPSGLPAKVASGGTVMDGASESVFKAAIDSFKGNSGSPVFNTARGAVVGVLVRNAALQYDYVRRPGESCSRANRCGGETPCRGEEVFHARAWGPYVPLPAIGGRLINPVEASTAVDLVPGREVAIPFMASDSGVIADVGVSIQVDGVPAHKITMTIIHPDGSRAALVPPTHTEDVGIGCRFGESGVVTPDLRSFRGKPIAGTWRLVVLSRAPGALRRAALEITATR